MRPKPLMPPATAMVGAWAAAWGRVAAGRALPDVVNAEAPEARRAAAVYFLRWVFGLVRAPFFVGRGVLGLGQGQGYSPSAAGRVWLIHGVSCKTPLRARPGGLPGATGGCAVGCNARGARHVSFTDCDRPCLALPPRGALARICCSSVLHPGRGQPSAGRFSLPDAAADIVLC